MVKRSRTEITVETDRRFLIRLRKKPVEAWCADCASPARMVTPEEAAAMGGWRARAVYRWIEAGAVHFTERPDNSLQVCLNSLCLMEAPSVAAATPERQASGNDSFFINGPQHDGNGVTDAPESEIHLAIADSLTELPLKSDLEPGLPRRMRTWALTSEAFSSLLSCLDADREVAGEKYEDIRQRLIKYFECRGCLRAEDLADETINRATRRIAEGKEIWTSNTRNYFYGVARNVEREYWVSPERNIMFYDSCSLFADPPREPGGRSGPYSDKTLELTLQALDQSMNELPAESRDMILEYYKGDGGDKIRNRKKLAARLGIRPNALRIRVHRIRERLEYDVIHRLDDAAK